MTDHTNEILSKIDTCDLVEELMYREGVDYIQLEPYERRCEAFEGPMIILQVYD